jgi:hypothetical protein
MSTNSEIIDSTIANADGKEAFTFMHLVSKVADIFAAVITHKRRPRGVSDHDEVD